MSSQKYQRRDERSQSCGALKKGKVKGWQVAGHQSACSLGRVVIIGNDHPASDGRMSCAPISL